MYGKSIVAVFFFLNAHFLVCVEGEGDFFKVPLEVREKNRPKRLVDNVNDPDMMKLKSIQDKFFSIVENSSLGREFKSFNQLLHLLDSKAGIELGRLFLNGIMIGIGKERSSQLLTEFLDDFQYRMSPEFADALIDYKDFIKTIDLKMIPFTIEMLFKKDAMGNSLAQVPLGQLVDLIQPEATKYGIDVRSFINGILGKGNSTFPEMVRKMIHNFNITSMMNSVTKSFAEGLAEIDPPKKYEGGLVENKRTKKDQSLMIFKPFVARLLKENEIDLEAEAVIQVLTPFLNNLGLFLQSLIPSQQSNRKDFNFAQLLPLMGLFSSQMKKSGRNSKDQGGNILEAAMSLMENMGKNHKNMDVILNLATHLTNNGKQDKNGKSGSKATGHEGEGIDIPALMQIAQSLVGNSRNEGLDTLSGLVKQMTQGSNTETQKIMEMVSNLMEGIAKTKNDVSGQQMKSKTGKVTPQYKRGKTFPEAFEQFLLRIQTDEKSHVKIKDALAFGKHAFSREVGSIDELKQRLQAALRLYEDDIGNDIEALFLPFSYSQEDWDLFIKGLEDKEFKEKLVLNTIDPVTDIVMLVVSDGFQKKQNTFLTQKAQEIFSSFGLKGVKLNNFPERLRPFVNMASKGWGLPVNFETLLEPLKNSLKETWIWYTENVNKLRLLQKKKIESIVAQSLKHDVANPLTAIWKISEASKSSASCVPRAVCQLVRDITPDHSLKLLLTQLASILYGGFRANNEDNFLLFVQVARAAVFKGECEKYFPIQCPEDYHFIDDGNEYDGADDEPYEHEFDTHQEL